MTTQYIFQKRSVETRSFEVFPGTRLQGDNKGILRHPVLGVLIFRERLRSLDRKPRRPPVWTISEVGEGEFSRMSKAVQVS